jgi:hypothetical protein
MDILSMNAQWISSIWLIYFLIFLQDITSEFLKNNNNRWIPNWRIIGTDGYWNNLISTQHWYSPPTQQGWNEKKKNAAPNSLSKLHEKPVRHMRGLSYFYSCTFCI